MPTRALIQEEFSKVVWREKPDGHQIVSKILERICPDEKDDCYDDFQYFIDKDYAQIVINVVRIANSFKDNFYGYNEDIPEALYEYLISFRLIEVFPYLENKLSDEAQRIANEVNDYFLDWHGKSEFSSKTVTYGALVRAYADCARLYDNVKGCLGTKNGPFPELQTAAFATLQIALYSTDIEEKLRKLVSDIDFYQSVYYHDAGWYFKFAQDNFNTDEPDVTAAFKALELPSAIEPVVVSLYQYFRSADECPPFETFISVAQHAIRPMSIACHSIENISSVHLLVSLFAFGRDDEKLMKTVSQHVSPEIIKYWDAYDNGELENDDIIRQFQEGLLCYDITRLQDLIIHIGDGKAAYLQKDVMRTLHILLAQTPKVLSEYIDESLSSKYFEMRQRALELNNKFCDKTHLPFLPETGIPYGNDNYVTYE